MGKLRFPECLVGARASLRRRLLQTNPEEAIA